ncbi:SRPBCC domain-containing protein [Dankookia rubra]|uniref:SRPBCC domain-containing protein n=1 Tax=Dankookia rubra TaxID=1442381 RepID=A0A4R5QKD3_9PROT|nr:SRPBCC domain-containing protein [Dankookia rubra]TDH63191.1 SRPBCC domain-containing protein [Dankookia rubra]
MAAAEPGPEFTITRLFRAPRRRVWDAWTKPEMLAQWFGPKGVTTTVLRFELRPGGLLHARMEMPEGGTMWARFVYREVVPPARLVWAHAFGDAAGNIAPSPFGGAWPPELLTTVTFEPASGEAEATQVTLRWSPIEATAEERAAFAAAIPSMSGGWGGSFDQLDRFLG